MFRLRRGGTGVNAWHAHEVAHDAVTNKAALDRYHHVGVVKVPARVLSEWRAANRNKSGGDRLMPGYSPQMVYACLTKTHFLHCLTLAMEGMRALFNKGVTGIDFADSDEWKSVREDADL